MELRAAVLALALLSLAGSQAAPVDKGDVSRLRELARAVESIIAEVMQVIRRTGEWINLSELAKELELQARDLSDQLELEVSPELRQGLMNAFYSTLKLMGLALSGMEPYVEAATEQTAQVLEQVLEQAEVLGLDLPGALQAGAKWMLELKEQLAELQASPSSR